MTTGNSSSGSSARRNGQPAKPPFAVRIAASVFGAGYSPVASGTVGSAAALAVYWLAPGSDTWWALTIAAFLTYFIGIPLSTIMENHYGEDPGEVVIDEAAGMWLALVALPKAPLVAIAAFLVFRVFDIIKPYPANAFDRMKGGFGIMTDDMVAGLYANVVIQLLLLIEPIHHILIDTL